MSRIGNKPIAVPDSVTVEINRTQVSVKGPKGELTSEFSPSMTITIDDGVVKVARESDEREHRALHGLTRSLLANMVTGVSQGFQKSLELMGVGYRANQSGENVVFQVGFSHTVEITPIPGTKIEVEGNNKVHVHGMDKQLVGELAARIKSIRPPNAYTGKGIRYAGEVIRLKPGKASKRA